MKTKTLIALAVLGLSLGAQAKSGAPQYCKPEALTAAAKQLGVQSDELTVIDTGDYPYTKATSRDWDFEVTSTGIEPGDNSYAIGVKATSKVTGEQRGFGGYFDAQDCRQWR